MQKEDERMETEYEEDPSNLENNQSFSQQNAEKVEIFMVHHSLFLL